MAKNRKPLDKLRHVKQVYEERIIPSIRRAYEKGRVIEGTFILFHCAILSLSGFYKGAKETNSKTYIPFVEEFFPKRYDAKSLWKELRNYLVHAFTFVPISKTSTYVLTYSHPEYHLQERQTKNKITFKFINLENFIKDLEQATKDYFKKVEEDPVLLKMLCKRYKIAKPHAHISDNDIARLRN